MSPIAWRGTCRARFVPWLVVITAVAILGSMWAASTVPSANGETAPAWVLWLLALVGVIVVVAGLILGVVEVSVEQTGIVLRYGSFGWPTQVFVWSDITTVTAIDVHPMEWGGWGYRWLPWKRGTATVMRAGSGIRIDRANGHVFVVTVDGASDAVVACRPFLKRN